MHLGTHQIWSNWVVLIDSSRVSEVTSPHYGPTVPTFIPILFVIHISFYIKSLHYYLFPSLGYQILGRIIMVMVPFLKGEKKAASGFAEEEDDYD